MMDFGITFLLTRANLELPKPLEIIPEHCLRKATSKEVCEIDKLIDPHIQAASPLFRLASAYKTAKDASGNHYDLPEKEWLYWVIEFQNTNASLGGINKACSLLEVELDFGPSILYKKGAEGISAAGYLHGNLYHVEKLNNAIFEDANNIPMSELDKIGILYRSIESLTNEYPFISDALDRFFQSRTLVRGSNFKIVGYFSAIELLITHKPRLNESLDSITHQLVNKMILLSKRYETSIESNCYFESLSIEQVWKKLYTFRSAIAHGGSAKFTENDFKALKGMREVEEFLRKSIKQLILLALREPEFLADLKKC